MKHRMYGTYENRLDDKNRIRIPARFLSVLDNDYKGEILYFVIYTQGRIALMPESVLDERIATLQLLQPDDQKAMDALSIVLGSVEEVSKDGQGRATISKFLRKEASIEREVVTVGMGDYFEIWAKEERDKTLNEMPRTDANKLAYGRARELRT